MLDFMRRNSNSWGVILVFGVITFVFAINFGPWVGNLGGETPYAAEVNHQVITFAELQMAYTQQSRQFGGAEMDEATQKLIKKMLLDRLITKALLAQLAQSQGYSVPDAELAKFIRTEIFAKDKELDRENYRRAIYSNYQMTESQFENQLRQDLLAEQMADLVESVIPTPQKEDKQADSLGKAKLFDQYVQYLKKQAEIKTAKF